jgi:hypothetical protein
MHKSDIISGEKLQEIAHVFLGKRGDFAFNPRIHRQHHKQVDIHQLPECYENPTILFCYTFQLDVFATICHKMKHPFILLTHNADHEVRMDLDYVRRILTCPNLHRWYAQNLGIANHPKLRLLPIGLANEMWPHGKFHLLPEDPEKPGHLLLPSRKSKSIYFQFNVDTNRDRRAPCLDTIRKRHPSIPWLPMIDPIPNMQRLMEYQFCICPQGNGVDTHRLWECFYFKTVPIVVQDDYEFIVLLRDTYHAPMVVLKSWDQLNPAALRYEDYSFEHPAFVSLLSFSSVKAQIEEDAAAVM